METSQYLRRTREYVPPGRVSIIDNRTNIATIKLLNLICLKILYPNSYHFIKFSYCSLYFKLNTKYIGERERDRETERDRDREKQRQKETEKERDRERESRERTGRQRASI